MMHEKAKVATREKFEGWAEKAKETDSPTVRTILLRHIDQILDQYNDWDQLATNWDAAQWGLDPDGSWCVDDLAQLRALGGADWPREPTYAPTV